MKKSQLSRIILSFIVVITMFLTSDSTNLIIDATEDASLQDLSSYELIAENVIDDTSIAGKTFDLYCYDFKPMASLFVLNSSEEFRNSIALWEAATLAFKPEDIPKRAIEAKGYYMTVILSILKSNYQSDSIINQLTDFTESSEEISSLYNDFIKLYKETKNIDLIEKINSNSGLTDEHKESLKEEEINKLEPTIVEFAELEEYIDQPVRTYSSGMKARLGFSVNVNIEPEILIVDEALSVGDEAFKKKCTNKINEIIEKDNVTLLFVTHSTSVAKEFCKRGIVMKQGKMICDTNIDDAIVKYKESI